MSTDLITETETGGELARIIAAGDPDAMLLILERRAATAPRMRALVEKVLVNDTYPEDWTIQGDGDKARACLSSAGAERIGRNFPINTSDVTCKKESWEDSEGKAYRYVYTGYASLYDRKVYAEGSYSTRDEFLGKKGGKWRPLEEINEGDIRAAAYHYFLGNGTKALLGLRGIPVAEYQRIMQATGQDAQRSSQVQRGRGTQGGASAEEHAQRRELVELCVGFANDGRTVEEIDGEWHLVPIAADDDREPMAVAAEICERLSSFEGKGGEVVPGKGAKALGGKWLGATLAKARKLAER